MNYPNWFSNNVPIFTKFLSPFFNKSNLKFLQIGAYTGDASKWLLENILTDQTSILVDVDTWLGSEEGIHKKFDWSDVEEVYDKKMANFKNIVKQKGNSESYLTSSTEMFDFIYIDGDHTSSGVYKDATLSFPLLKINGIMAFDDYLWHHDSNNPELEPKLGIDKFLKEHKDKLKILFTGYQVWIKKV